MASYLSNWNGVFADSLSASTATAISQDLTDALTRLDTFNIDYANLVNSTYISGGVSVYGASGYDSGTFVMRGSGFSESATVVNVTSFDLNFYSGWAFGFYGNLRVDVNTGDGTGSITHILVDMPSVNVDLYGNFPTSGNSTLTQIRMETTDGVVTALGNFTYNELTDTVSGNVTSYKFVDPSGHYYQVSGMSFSFEQLDSYSDANQFFEAAMAGNDVVAGGTASDVLMGFGGDDTLNGAGGADTMMGGAGNDIYTVDHLNDSVIEYEAQGVDTVRASLSWILGEHLENLVLTGTASINGSGNSLDNTIAGNSGNNVLDGMAGADAMSGGAGNDDYYVDNLLDTVTEGTNGGADRVFSSLGHALGANIEELTLTGTDSINGSGNGLDNKIRGNSGNNELDGGVGNDTMEGGLGNDVYFVDSQLDVVIEEVDGGINDIIRSTVSYTLAASIETLLLEGSAFINGTGNELDNSIYGNNGDNTLDGGGGNDLLYGNAGNDIYVVNDDRARAYESDNEGFDEIWTTLDFGLSGVGSVEKLVLMGAANINGSGNVLNNTIIGNGGNNLIDGGVGADELSGGGGNDEYMVDDAGDRVHEFSGNGYDKVNANVSFVLEEEIEELVLYGLADIAGTGNARANLLTGNFGNNVLNGEGGNDTLDGGQGGDTLIGGRGNDYYVVDDAGDQVIEEIAGGRDAVESSVSFNLEQGIERLLLSGVNDVDATGNDLDNELTGNVGNNTLDGGLGRDLMRGGAGNDSYVIDSIGDYVIEHAGEGNDTIISGISYTLGDALENLTLTGRAYSGTGNSTNNELTGNAYANRLDGRGGADTMAGGAGNDTYIVDNAGDVVTEILGEGADRIMSNISWVLGDNVEFLILGGTANISGTGNALDNQLTGNIGSNVLSGGGGGDLIRGGLGSDTLIGGTGADTLTGGRGNDLFVFDALDAIDAVTDFTNGDRIQLDHTTFSALGIGSLAAADFAIGAGVTQAQDASDRIMFNSTTGNLYYDADGSASGSSAVQFAHLNVHALGAQDIFIV